MQETSEQIKVAQEAWMQERDGDQDMWNTSNPKGILAIPRAY